MNQILGKNFSFLILNPSQEDIKILRRNPCIDGLNYIKFKLTEGDDGIVGASGILSTRYQRSTKWFWSVLAFHRASIILIEDDITKNAVYLSKDESYSEYGTIPSTKKVTINKRWSEARAAAEHGKWDLIPDDIYIQYYEVLHKIFLENNKDITCKTVDLTTTPKRVKIDIPDIPEAPLKRRKMRITHEGHTIAGNFSDMTRPSNNFEDLITPNQEEYERNLKEYEHNMQIVKQLDEEMERNSSINETQSEDH